MPAKILTNMLLTFLSEKQDCYKKIFMFVLQKKTQLIYIYILSVSFRIQRNLTLPNLIVTVII